MLLNPKSMIDLHKQFIQLGREKNKIQYKLLHILPEIFKTEIYKKYTKTIEGYALRFAQIPYSVTQKTLKLEKHLENKPCLKAAVGQVGIHKVALLASVVKPENDEIIADKVIHMSKPALQELSKELRNNTSTECRAVPTTIKIELDPEMTFLFLKLKKKYGGNNQEVMKKILTVANEEKLQKTANKRVKKSIQTPSPGMRITKAPAAAPTRYIRKHVQQEALEKSNHRCGYNNCNRPPDDFHHSERFAKTKINSPENPHENIIPLCKLHHEFMHNGIVQNETQGSRTWKIKFLTKQQTELNHIDQLYRQYRQAGGYA